MQASKATPFISESSRRFIDSKLYELQESILAGPVPQDRLDACAPWFAQKHLQVISSVQDLMSNGNLLQATCCALHSDF
jgi:hypothetical protein